MMASILHIPGVGSGTRLLCNPPHPPPVLPSNARHARRSAFVFTTTSITSTFLLDGQNLDPASIRVPLDWTDLRPGSIGPLKGKTVQLNRNAFLSKPLRDPKIAPRPRRTRAVASATMQATRCTRTTTKRTSVRRAWRGGRRPETCVRRVAVAKATGKDGPEERQQVDGYDMDQPSLLESEAVGIAIKGAAVLAVGVVVALVVKLATPVFQVVESNAPNLTGSEFVAIR